jgi:DNA-binding NarL/FixJ family response regulator
MNTQGEKVRVLLVDDHTVVRRGLRKILESTNEIEVVGEVGDGAKAVAETASLAPDVVVMDVGLPGMNGIEATQEIRTKVPKTQVLMLSMHADEQYISRSVAAGAKGYLLKDADDQDLVSAVLAVRRGESHFSSPSTAAASAECSPDVLSPREREVLARVCAGRTNREIAGEFELSVSTVETHRKHIIEKLDLHSTAELVRYAIRHRIAS